MQHYEPVIASVCNSVCNQSVYANVQLLMEALMYTDSILASISSVLCRRSPSCYTPSALSGINITPKHTHKAFMQYLNVHICTSMFILTQSTTTATVPKLKLSHIYLSDSP